LKIAALLTAKGTSTFANKNITPVLGKPLLSYPARAARDSKLIDAFYASSDSETILNIAAGLGYKKIRRPAELAQPESQHVDAIKHALEQMHKLDSYQPDILVVLLGNTATVKTAWIDEGIRHCIENPDVSAAVPVFQDQDHHPFRAKRVNTRGFLDTFIDFSGKRISTNRQDLEPCYFLCHNFWVLKTVSSVFAEGGQQPWTFMGSTIKPIIVDECFDIHDADDIQRCKKWLQANI
jgi:CMP-N,N'-diacetyllegionaminic acid synthase